MAVASPLRCHHVAAPRVAQRPAMAAVAVPIAIPAVQQIPFPSKARSSWWVGVGYGRAARFADALRWHIVKWCVSIWSWAGYMTTINCHMPILCQWFGVSELLFLPPSFMVMQWTRMHLNPNTLPMWCRTHIPKHGSFRWLAVFILKYRGDDPSR